MQHSDKQKTLLEFFELIEKPTWQTVLHNMIQKYGMQIWDIDISKLLNRLLNDAYKKENLKNASLIVLICTILLKSKARRIGLKDLEQNIKEEIKEIEKLKEPDALDVVGKHDLEKYNELLELETKLKRLFAKKEKHLKAKDRKQFQYIVKIESYFQLKSKLIKFFAEHEEITYSELKKHIETNNSLIMGLLHLNTENKIKLKQEKAYEDFIIKKVRTN